MLMRVDWPLALIWAAAILIAGLTEIRISDAQQPAASPPDYAGMIKTLREERDGEAQAKGDCFVNLAVERTAAQAAQQQVAAAQTRAAALAVYWASYVAGLSTPETVSPAPATEAPK
jgi:hypothetical protein